MSRRPRRLTPIILLEAANLASGVGNAIVMLTIPWLVLERTGSAASAGLVAAVSALPAVAVAPLVGWLVDRFGRKVVSVVSDILSALAVADLREARVGRLRGTLVRIVSRIHAPASLPGLSSMTRGAGMSGTLL